MAISLPFSLVIHSTGVIRSFFSRVGQACTEVAGLAVMGQDANIYRL